jgi:CBS domain-containing protein
MLRNVMSPDVFVVSPADTLAHVRNVFMKRRISRVVVYDKAPVGVLTEKDVTRAFLNERRGIDEVRVREAMHKGVITADVGESPETVARIMVRKNISGVPIMAQAEMAGIVTKSDLVRYFSQNYRGRARISEVMQRDVPTVKEFHSIFQAAKLMRKRGTNKLVVLHDREVAGVLSERDISLASFGVQPTKLVFVRRGDEGPLRRSTRFAPLTVGDVMSSRVISITPDEDAAKGARVMLDNSIGCLVVERDGRLAGIVTKMDYVRYLAEQGATG